MPVVCCLMCVVSCRLGVVCCLLGFVCCDVVVCRWLMLFGVCRVLLVVLARLDC